MIGVIACGVFARAIANGHAIDDGYVLGNPLLDSAATLPRALVSPWWVGTGLLYRPLTLLMLGAEQLAAGPWLSHGINVLLYGAIAMLVTALFWRVVPARAALAAGLLFAVLPVHAESVSSVVGRAELLCAVSLVGLLLVTTSSSAPTRASRIAVALLSAAALASKETGAVAPALALAAAWTLPHQRQHARTWALAASAGTVALLLARVGVIGTLGGDLMHPAFRATTAASRIELALAMLPGKTAMLVLPIQPAIDYSPTTAFIEDVPAALVASGVVLVAMALAICLRHAMRPNAGTLGVVIATATLLPTANLLFGTGVISSGRVLFSPSIGACLASAWALSLVGGRQRLRWGAQAAIVVLVVASAVVSWRESVVWRDSDSVLAAVGDRQPSDYRVPMFAAYAARDAGRNAEAVALFGRAIALFEGNPEVNTDAATVALRVLDSATAVAWLRAALQAKPRAVRARTRLAGILKTRGDTSGMRALLREGLASDPTMWTFASMLEDPELRRAGRCCYQETRR